MPILKEEPSIFPATLLDMAAAETERRWWAVYAKARQEKSLARDLFSREIPFYLPLVKQRRVVRGRKQTTFAPLFGGYVFLFADEAERVQTLTTNRISRLLPVDDAEGLLRDLQQIRMLIAADAPLTIERRLVPGQKVRVKGGPFMGVEGTVLQRRGEMRLLVSVNFLQQGASVEIEDCLLEKLD
jgi:transcriptional antiterminator RfaH